MNNSNGTVGNLEFLQRLTNANFYLHVIISGVMIVTNVGVFAIMLSRSKTRNWRYCHLYGIFIAALGVGVSNIGMRATRISAESVIPIQSFLGTFNYFIAAVTGDRFLSIQFPMRYNNIITKPVLIGVTIGCFVYNFAVVGVTYFLYGEFGDRSDPNHPVSNIISWVLFSSIYIIPTVATVALYIGIIVVVAKRIRFLYKASPQFATATKASLKPLIQLGIFVTLYSILWLPYSIFYLINPPQTLILIAVRSALLLLIFVHIAVNPIIYIIFTKSIKDEVLAFLGRGSEKSSKPHSNTLRTNVTMTKGETFSTTFNTEISGLRKQEVVDVTEF